MRHKTIIVLSLCIIGCLSLGYNADGGWLFNRGKKCTPNTIQRPDKPFPIDELFGPIIDDEIPIAPVSVVCTPELCPVEPIPVPPVPSVPSAPETVDVDAIGDLAKRVSALEAGATDIDAIIVAVIARLEEHQPAKSPDISIIVGEVLKRLPPQVAYYEIVPRAPR